MKTAPLAAKYLSPGLKVINNDTVSIVKSTEWSKNSQGGVTVELLHVGIGTPYQVRCFPDTMVDVVLFNPRACSPTTHKFTNDAISYCTECGALQEDVVRDSNIGDALIAFIVRNKLFRTTVIYPDDNPDHPTFIYVWSSGAAEQLEAEVKRLIKGQTNG